MIILMCDDIELASLDKDTKILTLRVDFHPNLIPKDLFSEGKTSVNFDELIEWLSERIFPPNRVGVDKLLKELGLNMYDPWLITQCTRASLMTDGFWIKFNKKDKYETQSVRGRFDIPAFSTLPKFQHIKKEIF